MEWIKQIIAKHTKEDGTVDVEAVNKEISAEFPKNAVPKDQYNSKVQELKTANDTLATLQKDNKDAESLQAEITKYKDEVEKLQADQAEKDKNYALKDALTQAGAKDVEYMTFKLGDVEVNKDGSIKDLDSKIKDLKANYADQFKADDKKETKPNAPGYQVIDSKLDKGSEGKAYSFEQLKDLTTEEINQNWDAVSAALEKGEDE
jgi:predicted RNase H-like nuclease (RuvC/YqgF family)